MTRRKDNGTLLLQVMAELGAGRIEEAFIHDKQLLVDGFCDGRRVVISPAIQTVDSVVHELLHRRFPHWPESYVRGKTTYLLRRMSEAQIQTIYAEYQARAVKRKHTVPFPE